MFKIKCSGTCGQILKLLKDSTEGKKVFCGECYSEFKKKEGENK